MEYYYLHGWELIAEKVLQVGMLLFIIWNVKLLLFEKNNNIEGDNKDKNEQI
ncbi:hypothetical protein RRV45_18710 [Bacillus sp. DTU_2020_1000418_1_SI_GHA_SEK_038]|uniref:hypothetical protein n=1 Tax=Bacillus sp. DTU_2020_1000418_1_SI_GHA_SEK_038 TaxID=3077585 RepID=UPI0028EE82CF|nr:hypothetical protein [Bacillus sp. DTU_2020_1000418_1_SI_GHA_SEK_038]WNS74891.1 hypothetical protein RRV45_18710 [Bacillus sp. DTU_2020_1000418_1_SI_GHA_SEK_038]